MRVPKPKTILENSCTPLCCPYTQAMKFIRLHEHLHIRRPKPDFMKFMISGALPAPRLHEIHEFPGLAEAQISKAHVCRTSTSSKFIKRGEIHEFHEAWACGCSREFSSLSLGLGNEPKLMTHEVCTATLADFMKFMNFVSSVHCHQLTKHGRRELPGYGRELPG